MNRIGLRSTVFPNRRIGRYWYAYINLEKLKDCASRMDMDYDEVRSENDMVSPVPKKEKLLNVIKELERVFPDGIPQFEIIHRARLFYPEEKLMDMVEKFQTEGILYCPRPHIFCITKGEKQIKLTEIDDENNEIGEESEDLEDAPENE